MALLVSSRSVPSKVRVGGVFPVERVGARVGRNATGADRGLDGGTGDETTPSSLGIQLPTKSKPTQSPSNRFEQSK